MSDENPIKRAAASAARDLAGGVGRSVADAVRQNLEAARTVAGMQGAEPRPDDEPASGTEPPGRTVYVFGPGRTAGSGASAPRDPQAPEQTASPPSSTVRGVASGVGRAVVGRVRDELDAARNEGRAQPVGRTAANVLGGLADDVGRIVTDRVRQELGAARSEAAHSAKAAGRGAGLLGGAAATGNTAVLFTGVAVWQGLGRRIGYTRSALVVAAVSGAATAVLASKGVAELGRITRAPRRRDGRPAGRTRGAGPTDQADRSM